MDGELPWYWCETHDEDISVCHCDDFERPRLSGRRVRIEVADWEWREGWDASMQHVVWTGGRRECRPITDVDSGGLT